MMQEVVNRLRRAGYKVTPQRVAIFEALLSRRDHPSAEVLFDEIRDRFPSISKATIYNTLHLLEKIGAIQELGFDDGTARYDTNVAFHVNLTCRSCGKIVDIEDDHLEQAWNKMVAATGATPTGRRLDLYHVCEACKATAPARG